MSSASPRPCAGCSRDLGLVMQTLHITLDGVRYEVCGHSQGCADRLLARRTRPSTTTMPTTNDTVRLYGLDGYRRWP